MRRSPSSDKLQLQAGLHTGLVQHLFRAIAPRPVVLHDSPSATFHPLDPLTAEEIRQAAQACRQYAKAAGLSQLRFNAITLQEPPKALQLQYQTGLVHSVPRRAYVIMELPTDFLVITAFVSLDGVPSITSWESAEGVQAMVSPDDTFLAEEVVLRSVEVQQLLLSRYGISDMSLVVCDPWYYGDRYVLDPTKRGRFMQCFLYLRSQPQDNHYAHPLDLVVNLELHSRTVLDCFMHAHPPPIPRRDCNFAAALVNKERPWRTGLKPLNILQPEGPSFQVQGNHVRWQKWDFRVSFNYREGLVFHNVGYEDQGRIRPVMHRMSLVEVIVPYGDPRHPFEKKCAYDMVDYGLGNCANSLELGCDCLGHIRYFDGMLCDSAGEPKLAKKVVCMHEEDHGLMWKHVEYRDGRSDSRRSRRLNLNFIATIANYEYQFATFFYQDGSIQYEVKLTGCLSTNGLSAGEGPEPTHGTLLAPGLNAQVHQHFFCVRMDMAVDCPQGGNGLTVTEVNLKPDPEGPDNPHGVGFSVHETVLASELQARRRVNSDASRIWKIKNMQSRNTVTGAPVGWKLMPSASPPLYALPSSSHARRGIFATRNLWVTPHSDTENFPAGLHPLQEHGCQGLEHWTAQDRPVADADVVLWHSFGVTHVPRIEDWPVMPVEQTGFWLKPANFFDANPALDIAPELNAASREDLAAQPAPVSLLRSLAPGSQLTAQPAASCAGCQNSREAPSPQQRPSKL